MRSAKSFAAHLTGICAALEYENVTEINAAIQRWLNGPRAIDKPKVLPHEQSELTIVDVHRAPDPDSHHSLVQKWAQEVWQCWADHHDLARGWIEEALAGTR